VSDIVPLASWYPTLFRTWVNEGRRLPSPKGSRTGYTVHHTAGGVGQHPLTYARWVASWHYSSWSRPGGYNFLIGADGVILEMCGWDWVGAHAPGANRETIGVSFQGTFKSRMPNRAQLDAFAWLVGTNEVPNRQQGHRDASLTSCPGDRLYRALPLPVPEPKTDEVDMAGVSSWAQASWRRIVQAGLLNGERPKDTVTREELAVVLDRLDAPFLVRQRAELAKLDPPTDGSALSWLVRDLRARR